MVNAYTVNSLKGCEYYIKKCSCGHIEKRKKINTTQFIKLEKDECCPICGAPLMTESCNELTLAPIKQCGRKAIIKTRKKACYFELSLYDINFSTKIDFQKKGIKIDKRTIKNKMVKMVFDATQEPCNFIKYFNSENEEIDKDCFLESISRDGYTLYKKEEIGRKFNLMTSYFLNNYITKANLINIIGSLENKKDFFIKYEQIIKSNIDPYPIHFEIDLSKTNPIEMLNVRPFTFKYMRERKGSINTVVLKMIRMMENKIGDQVVNYLQTFGTREEGLQIQFASSIVDLCCEANLSVNKLYKYIYKEVPMKQYIINPLEIIRLLRDSFNMSKDLGLPFEKNSKALLRYHDILALEYKTIEDKRLSERFSKEMEKKQYLNYEVNNNNYCIIVPKESQELIKEGKELRHCVGSYIRNVAKGNTHIVFLREKNAINKPHTTIEIDINDKIIQVRQKHNGLLKDREAINLIKQWAYKHGLTIDVELIPEEEKNGKKK